MVLGAGNVAAGVMLVTHAASDTPSLFKHHGIVQPGAASCEYLVLASIGDRDMNASKKLCATLFSLKLCCAAGM